MRKHNVSAGVHGGQVNVTDGRYVYMRGPCSQENQPLHEYLPTDYYSEECSYWKKFYLPPKSSTFDWIYLLLSILSVFIRMFLGRSEQVHAHADENDLTLLGERMNDLPFALVCRRSLSLCI